jgi:hypothetical protein
MNSYWNTQSMPDSRSILADKQIQLFPHYGDLRSPTGL